MKYEIECYIETIDSEGSFTVHGAEGFCLEKGDKTYNILWPDDKSKDDKLKTLVVFEQNELNLKVNLSKQQRMFQLLLDAKVNRQKVMMNVDCEMPEKINSLIKVTIK